MFSNRVPKELAANRLATAVAALRAEGRAIVDLTIANPTRAGFEYPSDLLAPLGDPRALRYDPAPFGSEDARAAVADDYRRQGISVAPDRIVLTASTSDAYGMLFKLLCDAGDEVLVPRPSYPLFDHLTRLDLAAPRPYDLDYHGEWTIDCGGVERALTPRTRALLLVSPNNPTGSFVSRDDLDRLAALCGPRGIAIVVDEVFADYELTPGAAAVAGRPIRRDDVLAFSLGGLSKSAGLPQAKLGWIAVSGPASSVAAALERLELICDTYLSVSTPVQVAARSLIDGGAAIRAQIAGRIRRNYGRLCEAIARVPVCRVLRSGGGWYAVVQVPTLESEEDLVLRLLQAGVLTHPGYFFDFPRESFLIVSLLPEPGTFDDGIDRIARHFDCTTRDVSLHE
jgi:alanine-synthesizing transaminase